MQRRRGVVTVWAVAACFLCVASPAAAQVVCDDVPFCETRAASAEFRTSSCGGGTCNWGQTCGGGFTSTHRSDDVRQCLRESSFPSAYRLEYVWIFQNVPAGPQCLVHEGYRPEADEWTEDFEFLWCQCPGGSCPSSCANNILLQPIEGAAIDHDQPESGEMLYFADTGATAHVRIMIKDDLGAEGVLPAGIANDVYVDHLKIRTKFPGAAESDGDGFADVCDVCPDDYDPGQQDTDGDGLGDACDVCPNDPNNAGSGDCDGDGQADCVDTDDDNDGEVDATDCDDCNPDVSHLDVEGVPSAGGALRACQDGLDNDCDGVVDLDCALDIDAVNGQIVNPGTVTSGSVADLRATSAQNTYEVLTETGGGTKKKLTGVWTFNTAPTGIEHYDVAVEGFRSAAAGADSFTFSYLKKSSTAQCTASETGWIQSGPTITDTADDDQVDRVNIGALSPATICVRVQDSFPTGDNQADTLTLDRLYLFPTPVCTDADGDGYTSSCSGCVLATCPALDCDDSDAAESPGGVEGPPGDPSCSDGKDNDCDGAIDAVELEDCVGETVAAADHSTGPGTIVQGTWVSTTTSDNVREILREGLQSNKSRLKHVWRFDNVPAGSLHELVVEGSRADNPEGDDFRFGYNTTGGSLFIVIENAVIDSSAETTASFPFAGSVSGTIYVLIEDTVGTGSQLDTVAIDRLSIRTVP